MTLKVIYDGPNEHLKVFNGEGGAVFMCEARNDSVADNAWRADAGCPPGNYTLNAPETDDPGHEQTEMGPYFVPLTGIPGHSGIGIHGGGSCVYPNSMAPEQGWCPTLNCIRLQNRDLITFCGIIKGFVPIPIQVVQSESE